MDWDIRKCSLHRPNAVVNSEDIQPQFISFKSWSSSFFFFVLSSSVQLVHYNLLHVSNMEKKHQQYYRKMCPTLDSNSTVFYKNKTNCDNLIARTGCSITQSAAASFNENTANTLTHSSFQLNTLYMFYWAVSIFSVQLIFVLKNSGGSKANEYNIVIWNVYWYILHSKNA